MFDGALEYYNSDFRASSDSSELHESYIIAVESLMSMVRSEDHSSQCQPQASKRLLELLQPSVEIGLELPRSLDLMAITNKQGDTMRKEFLSSFRLRSIESSQRSSKLDGLCPSPQPDRRADSISADETAGALVMNAATATADSDLSYSVIFSRRASRRFTGRAGGARGLVRAFSLL